MKILVALIASGVAFHAAAFRPPAVPLVSVEPHFSVWSAADCLYDKDTTHWTGVAQPLTILLDADGATYRLCGRGKGRMSELPILPQTECRVGATVTHYRFEGRNGLSAEIDFTTPRLTGDLDVFSRPVTYVTVRVKGAKKHEVRASISDAWVTNDDKAKTTWTTNVVAGVRDISVGRMDQTPFSIRGDCKRANWGYVHLVGPLTTDRKPSTTTFLLAYDNVKSVRFFGAELVDWWARGGKAFGTMLAEAVADASALEGKCREFDARFRRDMERIGGEKYADIAELSWRQSFAACKFVANTDGEPFMFSAENGSGGMIGTTDVFYPQFPHLLYSSLALAKASLAPTCIYAASANWPYSYAPHDLGLFPVAEGQYYGMKKGQAVGGGTDDTYRMPVEECGNMLILLASVAKADGNADFAGRWWDEVSKWAEYLAQFGYDPGNQLCTDDFAGHLAHNANLSVKSIVALASYALMADMRGERDAAAKYRALAEGMVPKWIEAAKGGAHGATRIAFDRPGTWSLKYNLVWDRVLGLGLFPPSVADAELRAYRALELPYGVPLDCRKTYTKSDWLVWCGAMTGRRDDLEFMCGGIHRFLGETPDRIPFSDWYMTDSRLYRGFIARSVVGGVFMPTLTKPIPSCAAAHGIAECSRIFEAEISDGVIHGAAVIAGGLDGDEVSASWGWADAAHTIPMTTRTVIDVASVTKAAAGVTAYLIAHAKGLVDFDVPFTNYLSSYKAVLPRNVTIRDLANHVSGFGEADGKPRVYFSPDAKTMLENILSMPPKEPARGKVAYSCRNYVLLGQTFEAATGRRIDDFCRKEIFDPVGMKDTSIGSPPPYVGIVRLAQTMGTKRPGVISDFVARPLWGAGIGTFNAGMFSTAEDMAKLMRVYLRGGVADSGARLFGAAEMAEIAPLAANRIEGARSFGWQSFSENMPEELFGTSLFHSGWSGQTVLFDMKRRRYAIVITTRCGDYHRAKRERLAAIAALMRGLAKASVWRGSDP